MSTGQLIRPAVKDLIESEASHAGNYDGFSIQWIQMLGWHVVFDNGHMVGPFHTSQGAFTCMKDAIDIELQREGLR